MRSIGFRVSPQCIYYCVAEDKDDEYEIINVDKIKVPVNMSIPYQLRHVKINIISILKEYNIQRVGIRATENNSKSISIPRIYIEGVILETLEGSTINNFYVGTIAKIASLLKEDKKLIKKYIENSLIFMDIENWDSFSKDSRESIITAIAAFSL